MCVYVCVILSPLYGVKINMTTVDVQSYWGGCLPFFFTTCHCAIILCTHIETYGATESNG